MSLSFRPIGSRPSSSDPTRDTMFSTSGTAASSACCTARSSSSERSSEIDGDFCNCNRMSPSSMVGMKLLPVPKYAPMPTSKTSTAIPNARAVEVRTFSSSGRYTALTLRISQGSWCSRSFNSSEASTGTKVSDSSSEAPSANTMVSATGANILPSSPSRVSNGRKVRQMISMPAVTGLATSWVAANTRCRRGRCAPGASGDSRLTVFSTTTTAASTSMPMAMASPPRLIRLALCPVQRISRKVHSAASGRISATTMAARSSPRNSNSSTTTSTVASSSAFCTVPTARLIRWLRS